ncbi:MAG: hypothetical protein ACOC1P_00540 [Minisyncoccales bacterium]
MKKQKSDKRLIEESKEFSKLVKIARTSAMAKSSLKLKEYNRVISLPSEQYFQVIAAADALDLFGQTAIGKRIYETNRLNFYHSRYPNSKPN